MLKDNLLLLASGYCAHKKLTLSTVGTYAAGGGHFFVKMAAEKPTSCTVRKYDRVLAWFDTNWPADLDWPAHIERPSARRRVS